MIINTLKDGSPNYRKWCSFHHDKRTAAKHGLNSIVEITAKRAGFDNAIDYRNSTHTYRYARLNYCENIDSRLGYVCTTSMPPGYKGHLDVDHKDGDPTNNDPKNLQTLCKNCHAYKSVINGDRRTPGRKALNVKY